MPLTTSYNPKTSGYSDIIFNLLSIVFNKYEFNEKFTFFNSPEYSDKFFMANAASLIPPSIPALRRNAHLSGLFFINKRISHII